MNPLRVAILTAALFVLFGAAPVAAQYYERCRTPSGTDATWCEWFDLDFYGSPVIAGSFQWNMPANLAVAYARGHVRRWVRNQPNFPMWLLENMLEDCVATEGYYGFDIELQRTVNHHGFEWWSLSRVDCWWADPDGMNGSGKVPTSTGYALEQNVPNPFNASTTITYRVPQAGPVQLVIYDVLGQQVRTLVHETQAAGVHSVGWDGTDQGGQPVSSGVYIYRLTGAGFSQSQRMMLLK